MTQIHKLDKQMPSRVNHSLETLGQNLRVARSRRGWTLEEMAQSMFVTRKTLSRLEKGDPGVGLSVLASALFVLGFIEDLSKLADPGLDQIGLAHEKRRMAGPVRKKRITDEDRDF
jgi:transcriptional regulator with XRE-family HTH domain